MRTAKSIITDILKEEAETGNSIDYIANRIITELRLERTVVMFPIDYGTQKKYSTAEYDSKKKRELREKDELYKAIYDNTNEENMSIRVYNLLRRNDYDTIEELLSLDGDMGRIRRMRNCGVTTSAVIQSVIDALKQKGDTNADS